MPTITVSDHELHYVQRGEGPPLLLIQGLSGTLRTWGDEFVDELARDFAVTAFDNRGMGGSSRVDDPFTVADMAGDALGLMDALEIEQAHVLGISMGGMIAQELVLQAPERVLTLTIGCSYSGGPGSVLTSEAVGRRLAASWQAGDREKAIRTAWEVNVSERFAADEEQYAAFRERALELRAPLPVIMLQVQAIGGHDLAARLGEITVPALVVHGDEDQMLSVENGRMIASRIPGARLEILEGVGHLFWVEEPQRSADLIREHAAARAATG